MRERITPGNPAAHGIAAQHEMIETKLVNNKVDRFAHAFDGVIVIGVGACQALAGQSERDQAVLIAKTLNDRFPCVQARGIAMEQYDGNAVGVSFVALVHIEAVRSLRKS